MARGRLHGVDRPLSLFGEGAAHRVLGEGPAVGRRGRQRPDPAARLEGGLLEAAVDRALDRCAEHVQTVLGQRRLQLVQRLGLVDHGDGIVAREGEVLCTESRGVGAGEQKHALLDRDLLVVEGEPEPAERGGGHGAGSETQGEHPGAVPVGLEHRELLGLRLSVEGVGHADGAAAGVLRHRFADLHVGDRGGLERGVVRLGREQGGGLVDRGELERPGAVAGFESSHVLGGHSDDLLLRSGLDRRAIIAAGGAAPSAAHREEDDQGDCQQQHQQAARTAEDPCDQQRLAILRCRVLRPGRLRGWLLRPLRR